MHEVFFIADDQKEKLRNGNDTTFRAIDNNNFYTSTPTYKNANGNISNLSLDGSNANYHMPNRLGESPTRNFEKEQLMNTINGKLCTVWFKRVSNFFRVCQIPRQRMEPIRRRL